ncbi:MAG: hypothetical protein HQM16_19125 [Deltaproteobacteria bacterium]|nr:hypothetical protein [Deltaproteobacteria bacterium]
MEWSQGDRHLGKFTATINKDRPAAKLGNKGIPGAPEDRQLEIHFNEQGFFLSPEGILHHRKLTPADIEGIFEQYGLRDLRDWGFSHSYLVAVTGTTDPQALAATLAQLDIVNLARVKSTGPAPSIPEDQQVTVVFKSTVHDPRNNASVTVARQHIRRLLKKMGLTLVHPNSRETTVGKTSVAARPVEQELSKSPLVRYTIPKTQDLNEARQIVVTFEHSFNPDDITTLLNKYNLRVVAIGHPDIYRLEAPEGTDVSLVASQLVAEGSVKTANTIKPLPQATIDGAIRGVARNKGYPWSETEYSFMLYQALSVLEKEGATQAQLEEFKQGCNKAPILGGFNPRSGD